MTKDKVLISVIMPVYNTGKFLRTAVDSILAGATLNMELILVDDGSTDGSSEICDKYSIADNRVIVIHQHNGGICNARNTALRIAKGIYIGFCDHDDVFDIKTWQACEEAICRYNYPDMIKFGKDYVFINKSGKTYRTIHMSLPNKLYDREEIVKNYLHLRSKNLFRFMWDGLYKKEIIENNHISFDPYFTHGGEDHDFCNNFSRYIRNIVTIEGIFYYHYLRESFSTSSKKIVNAGLLYFKTESERLLETLNIIKFDIKEHYSLYCNQLFETTVLPVIRYHIKARTNYNSIKSLVPELRGISIYKYENPTLVSLLKNSPQMGFFTYLFLCGWDNLLIFLLKIRYSI